MSILTAAALSLATLGCSTSQTIHSTDVPVIAGLDHTAGEEIVLIGDRLMLGRIHFEGETSSAIETLRATVEDYESHGWALQWLTGGLPQADAALVKDSRRVSIHVEQIEGETSKGIVTIEQLATMSAPE